MQFFSPPPRRAPISTVPPIPSSSPLPPNNPLAVLELAQEQLENLLDHPIVNSVLSETNACGFDVISADYDSKTDTYGVELRGTTPEDRCFCGDTINITAKKSSKSSNLQVLDAKVDRSYLYDEDAIMEI